MMEVTILVDDQGSRQARCRRIPSDVGRMQGVSDMIGIDALGICMNNGKNAAAQPRA